MADYSLSLKAAEDVDGIYEYSIVNFGIDRGHAYLSGLLTLLGDLAERPMLGTSAASFGPELRRFEYRSHVVFYLPTTAGVHIVRVLHASMDVRDRL